MRMLVRPKCVCEKQIALEILVLQLDWSACPKLLTSPRNAARRQSDEGPWKCVQQ